MSREGNAFKFNETQLKKKTIDGFLRNVNAKKQERELENQASRYFQLQLQEKVVKALIRNAVTNIMLRSTTSISLVETGSLKADFMSLKFGHQVSKRKTVLNKLNLHR